MSVIIRGMTIPKSCDECRFCVEEWCVAIEDWRKGYNTPPKMERIEECPLVEVPTYVGLKEELDEWVKHFPNNEVSK